MNIQYIYMRILKKLRGVAIRNSDIHKTSKVESGSTIVDTKFARHTFCGYDCLINNCEVGAFTSIASNVKIGGAMHPIEFVSTSPVFLSHKDSIKAKLAKHHYYNIPRTYIGNDVWIGEGVYVKAGVKIGDGAVIGMGSIVTKDVPPYSIFCGNPGKVVRFRFGDELIKRMITIQWWDLPDQQLEKLGHYITNPHVFVEKVEEL